MSKKPVESGLPPNILLIKVLSFCFFPFFFYCSYCMLANPKGTSFVCRAMLVNLKGTDFVYGGMLANLRGTNFVYGGMLAKKRKGSLLLSMYLKSELSWLKVYTFLFWVCSITINIILNMCTCEWAHTVRIQIYIFGYLGICIFGDLLLTMEEAWRALFIKMLNPKF